MSSSVQEVFMPASLRPRKAAKLSDSIHQKLNLYALAAAGVGVTILTQSSEAKIIYKPTHHILTNGTLPIPVAGTHDFTLSDKFYIITGSWSSQFLNILASSSAPVVGSKSASALRAGKVVGGKDHFVFGKVLMASAFCETQISSSRVGGPFANKMNRFLGLKFKLHGKTHYGWARFSSVKASACNGGPAISATLTGYAYETVPNKAIVTGKTKGPDVITLPAETTRALGHLALGRR
jgi:hypothetical protein